MTPRPTNWAGNYTYRAEAIYSPATIGELQAVVAQSGQIRALGSRHSFNDLADSPGALVSLANLPPVVEVDSDAATVKVAAGMRYAELARQLDRNGFALPNLASLPHISVGGACATGTHGSGVTNGCLATDVAELEMVTADGDLITISRADNADRLNGAIVGLGALGIVVSLTLDLVPSFELRQSVYERLPMDVLDEHFFDLVASAYSVSLFTDWRDSQLTQIWVNHRSDEPEPTVLAAPWFTATPADGPRHPVAGMSPESCTEQLGAPGRWFERLPHFRPEFTPSSGAELQSEYMIASSDVIAALHALNRVRERIHPVLQVCEIRTVAADELWLSPCYQQETVSIHFTWVADAAAVLPVVTLVEEQLAPFAPRPHWAKIFTIPPGVLQARYKRLADFRDLRREHDRLGKFSNAFIERCLGVIR